MATGVYLRVSSNSQSVASQRREIERYLSAHGIDDARWFIDEGISGAVMDRVRSLLQEAETIGGVTVVVGDVPSAAPDALRSATDWIRNKTDASAVLLATAADDKVTLIAGMSKVVVGKGLKAGDLIKEIAPLVGGRGGGRPDMAQGGGNDASGIPNALGRARSWIGEKLA